MRWLIDVDSHLTEPADLWTGSLPIGRWGKQIPHVRPSPDGGRLAWYIGEAFICGVPAAGTLGLAAASATVEQLYGNALDCDLRGIIARIGNAEIRDYAPFMGTPAAYDPEARLQWMNEAGIWAQVLYPNVAGFGGGFLHRIADAELRLLCVRRYNDYLADWCSSSPGRLLPIALVPFWSPREAADEVWRAASLGHRGIVLPSEPQSYGLPHLSHGYFDEIWNAAQATEMSINLHIASQRRSRESEQAELLQASGGPSAAYARRVALYPLKNMKAVAELLTSGLCERFPALHFVSVESGVGWLPFLLQSLDWQWMNSDASSSTMNSGKLLPSECFVRQVHACLFFEQRCIRDALERYPDNIMLETDFPHPGALAPHALSVAQMPREHFAKSLGSLRESTRNKIAYGNAARLYRVQPPPKEAPT